MSYNKSLICDYITCSFENADSASGAQKTFNIPASAYTSDARGDYCLVSVCDGAVNALSHMETIVLCLKGVLNSYSSNPKLDSIIASFSRVAGNDTTVDDCAHLLVDGDLQYLFKQRPNQIVFETYKVDDGYTALNVGSGVVTFKFEYLNKEAVVEQSFGEAYTAAFPQV